MQLCLRSGDQKRIKRLQLLLIYFSYEVSALNFMMSVVVGQAEGSSEGFQVSPMNGWIVVMCGWGRLDAGVL